MHSNYAQHQASKLEMQRDRAASGLCVACGKLSQTYRCKSCKLKKSVIDARYRAKKKENQMEGILEVEATVLAPGQIRLKIHGLVDDKGPDLVMNETLAREIVTKLIACLPEGKL